MAQEFTINSTAIEDKINQLLPSQGGFGAGIDFSASTMVVPIIDLTESASGSALRVDLQTAFSETTTSTTLKNVTNSPLISTTGYYKLLFNVVSSYNTGNKSASLNIFDGTSSVDIFKVSHLTGGGNMDIDIRQDMVIYLKAGHSLRGTVDNECTLNISSRQIADISGNLVNP